MDLLQLIGKKGLELAYNDILISWWWSPTVDENKASNFKKEKEILDIMNNGIFRRKTDDISNYGQIKL